MHLVFDLDNTLIDRDGAFELALERLSQKYRFELTNALKGKILEFDDSGRTPRREFCLRLAQIIEALPSKYELLWAEFSELYKYLDRDEAVLDMLYRLKTNASLSLLTNGSVEMQSNKIEASGLANCFEKIVISGAFGVHKPNLKIFERAMASEVNKDKTFMIGDDLVRDVLPALALGLNAIWINSRKEKVPSELTYHERLWVKSNVLSVEEIVAL
jgi:putative hydrolase of the HAD superfamily